MFFVSDNGGPAHQAVLDAVVEANAGATVPYGDEQAMDAVRARLRTIFEAPQASVHLVATGTAANALALASLCRPWSAIFCAPLAHINQDECGAPEFYTGGSKLILVGEGPHMTVGGLRKAIESARSHGLHGVQPGPVSLTQATECGTLYPRAEMAALCAVAHEFGLATHLDGARFANALAALGCTPAQMSWKCGIDVLSLGASKNGCLGVEAVIFFDPALGDEFELRRKRGGHLFSKHRYLSAQMLAYLNGDLWLSSARMANAAGARLADGLRRKGAGFLYQPQINMVFAELPRATHVRLHDAGARYYLHGSLEGAGDEMIAARLVCDWSTTDERIDKFLDLV